jgi:hypothetical protein
MGCSRTSSRATATCRRTRPAPPSNRSGA